MRVQVVFLADVLPRYRAGDVREVAGGYARNYLIPRELAAPATAQHLKRIEKIRKVAEERRAREAQETQGQAQRLEGATVTIRARAGDNGRLYGSITTAAIAEAIARELGQEVDRRLIHLPEPIRQLGTYSVSLRLHRDVAPSVTVAVEAEGRPSQPAPARPQPVGEVQEPVAVEEEPAALVEPPSEDEAGEGSEPR